MFESVILRLIHFKIKTYEKNYTFIFCLIASTQVSHAQCTEAQSDGPNFVGRNNNVAMFMGQSVQACSSNRLESVTFTVAGGNTTENVEFRVYSGAPTTPNGAQNVIPANLLYTQTVALPNLGGQAGTTGTEVTVTLDATLNLTNGNDYTFTLHRAMTAAAEIFRLRSDNTAPTYTNGVLVAYQKMPGAAATNNDDVDLQFSYTLTDSTILSVSETIANSSIVYPNPSKGLVTVDGVDLIALEIYNMLGQKVLTSNNKTIVTETLSTGNYFLKIATADGSTMKKIIVE